MASLAALCTAGCSSLIPDKIPHDPRGLCAGDRCYIEDGQFIIADRLYSRFGSLTLVDRHLREVEKWRDCEVNEAVYRLRKVHGLP